MLNNKIKPVKRPWHDCGSYFVSTIEPAINEPIDIMIRTEKDNVTKCFVEISNDGETYQSIQMFYDHSDVTNSFDYFKGTIPGQKQMFKYRFHLGNDNPENDVYYSRTHFGKNAPTFNESNHESDDLWCFIPGYHTPDWAKGVIWYSVMPDAFYNGDITNDEPISGANYSNSWNLVQHTLDYKYGGDLKGIETKLDYIKDLGCEALFMNPIFKSTQNAGYGPEFYKQIENSFGNAKALEDLSTAVHKSGMHYMIDIVLAFVAIRDIWFNKEKTNPFPGASENWDNLLHDYFFFDGEKGDLNAFRGKWGGIELNHANEDFCNKIYKGDDSYLKYYCSFPFNVDAIRFDCGGDLYGVYPDGKKIKDWQVVEKMRPILRAINPEILMLSEYSLYSSIDKGTWDSRWQLQSVLFALPYMKGEMTESQILTSLNCETMNVPRAFALCQYTSMSDHDRPRALGIERWAYKAYQLIQMTSVCAPCVYYGDEIKNEREHSTFYAMEWNEANWNYEFYNDLKALTSLRKQVPAIRLGAVKYLAVDDDRHILSFARIDETSLSITVTNKNPFNQQFVINTIDLEQPDGTVFTDWFTGKHYLAADGQIVVDVIPGGTVLVKGNQSSNYRNCMEISNIGDGNAEIYSPESKKLILNGIGKIAKTDSLSFVHTHLFNECRISSNIKSSGNAIMMLRATLEENSPFVCVKVKNKQLSVCIRKHKNGIVQNVATVPYKSNSVIEISRDSHNYITVYVNSFGMNSTNEINDQTESQFSGKAIIVDGIKADLPNHILGGFSILQGNAEFNNIVTQYSKETISYDDFQFGYSAMFDPTQNTVTKYIQSGLQLSNDSHPAKLLTNALDEDWTFKVSVKSNNRNNGEYCGIISEQDSNNAVVTGRMKLYDKNVLFIGKITGGKLSILHTVPDTNPNRKLIIQLQRIGTTYSAVFSNSGKQYKKIGEFVIANLCKERVGLVSNSTDGALFRWASFGNAIYDGKSTNCPVSLVDSTSNFADMKNVLTQPAYRIQSGDWDYANEGYVQKDLSGGQMGICNKYFTDFKADGTYLFDSGDGYITLEFGKRNWNNAFGDGTAIKINTSGSIEVIQDNKSLAATNISIMQGVSQRICIDYSNNSLIVYEGQTGAPILCVSNIKIPKGYFSYYTKGVIAHINNSLIASLNSPINYAADYEILDFNDSGVVKHWPHTFAFVNRTGIGVTNFETSATFKAPFYCSSPEGYVGFAFASPEGKFGKDKALMLVYNQYGCLALKNGDDILAQETFKFNPELSVNLKLIKNENTIEAYINNSVEPLLTYTINTNNGGVVSLCAYKTNCEFSNWTLKDITNKI